MLVIRFLCNQVRLDTQIGRNLSIGRFLPIGNIVPRNLPIRMILQLNNLYLPSEEFTSCDMVTPFGILSQTTFFPVRDKLVSRSGYSIQSYGKVNFYCWPYEKRSSKIKIRNGS